MPLLEKDGRPEQINIHSEVFFGQDIISFRIILAVLLLAILIPLFMLTRVFVNKRQQKRDLQAIMDNTSSLVYIKGLDGSYKFINKAFEQTMRVSNEQLIGASDDRIFSADIATERQRTDQRVMQTGKRTKLKEKFAIERRFASLPIGEISTTR